jgi:hypothetical protein
MLYRIVVVARSHFRRLSSENSDVTCAVAVKILHPPCALKFEVGRQGKASRNTGLSATVSTRALKVATSSP